MSRYCKCHPRVDETSHLVVHNAWDGREFYEQAEDLQPEAGVPHLKAVELDTDMMS
jgi:hypothetical protein